MAMLIGIWAGGLVIVWPGNGFRTHKKFEGRNLDHYTLQQSDVGHANDWMNMVIVETLEEWH